jgi:hypothetical protein
MRDGDKRRKRSARSISFAPELVDLRRDWLLYDAYFSLATSYSRSTISSREDEIKKRVNLLRRRPKLLTRLSQIAHVKPELANHFENSICFQAALEWRHHLDPLPKGTEWFPPHNEAVAELKAFVFHCIELSRRLEDLSYYNTYATAIAQSIGTKPDWPKTDNRLNFADLLSHLDHLAKRETYAISLLQAKRKPGRPNRGGLAKPPGRGAFSQLALRLLWHARFCGGRLTLDKNFGHGTLVELLATLRPFFPERLIPNSLPFSTLAALKSLDKKLAAKFPDLDAFDILFDFGQENPIVY